MSTPQGKPPFGLLEERGIDGLTSSDLKATMSPRGIDGAAEPESMTLKEAAQYLHRHYTTVYRLVHAREPPAFLLSKDWRVKRPDLEDGSRRREDARKSGRKPKPRWRR
jgi:excisionase family DNA binding protein